MELSLIFVISLILWALYFKINRLARLAAEDKEAQKGVNQRMMFRMIDIERKIEKIESEKYGKTIWTDTGS